MNFIRKIKRLLESIKILYYDTNEDSIGSIGQNVTIEYPIKCNRPHNLIIEDNVVIRSGAVIILHTGRLIIRKNTMIAQHLTVVSGNHTTPPPINQWQYDAILDSSKDQEQDVIINEDVWIGVNVTLLCGVNIGRGAIIGAGSVVTKSIPPYTIAVGNPCKVIKYKYNLEEIISREKTLYNEKERLSLEKIQDIFNQQKQKR